MTIGRKITGLPLPETPKEAPGEVHALVDAIEGALAQEGAISAAVALGRVFDYLTRYFAGVAGAVALKLGLPAETAVATSFEDVRRQLKERLDVLGEQATDPLSKLVRGVFFVGATRSTPTPRRHARLLDLGGIPIRGYRTLAEWIAMEPGTGDLATDSKANRELLRYLPILKEWVTATTTYFLDSSQGELSWDGSDSISFVVKVEGSPFHVGPITLSALLVDFFKQRGGADDRESPIGQVMPGETSTTGAQGLTKNDDRVDFVGGHGHLDVAYDSDELRQETSPFATPKQASPLGDETLEVEVRADEVLASVAAEAAEHVAATMPEAALAGTLLSENRDLGDAVAPGLDLVVREVVSSESLAHGEVAVPVGDCETIADEIAVADDSSEVEAGYTASLPPPTVADPLRQNVVVGSSTDKGLPVGQEEGSGLSDQGMEVASFGELSGDGRDEEEDEDDLDDDPFARELEDDPFDEERLRAEAIRKELGLDNPFRTPPSHRVETTVALRLEDLPLVSLPGGSAPSIEDGSGSTSPIEEVNLTTPARRTPPVLPFERTAAPKASSIRLGVSAITHELFTVSGPAPEFFDEIEVDSDCPEVIRAALTDLNGAIEANDSVLICGQMQRSFDLMIQFFAGIASTVLGGFDRDSLFDFELEDGRFDLDTKIELLVCALAALEEHWETNDAAILLWSVFYDTLLPPTDPQGVYPHTRLLGVEGLPPSGFMEFVDLCREVPGVGSLSERSACREQAQRYLPILAFWLENASPLFIDSEVDFVEEDGGNALSWAASVGRATLDGTPSGLWLEIAPSRWHLPNPELAQLFVVGNGPEVLLPVIDELNIGLESGDLVKAGLYTRVALDFLIQYFSGCAAALWREEGNLSEAAQKYYHSSATLEDKEHLLSLALSHLKADSDVGSSLLKLFSKSSLQYRAFERVAGASDRPSLAQWCLERDPASKADLLHYLPILRSWLGAANPWFSAGEQLFEEVTDEGRLEGVVAIGSVFLEMVEPEYVIVLAPECLELNLSAFEEELGDEVVEQEDDSHTEALAIAFPSPEHGPPILLAHLAHLRESIGDREAQSSWLGVSLEYLIQFFAGLVTTALGGKQAAISQTMVSYFRPDASLREREALLVAGVTCLTQGEWDGTKADLKKIFVDGSGAFYRHTFLLGAAGAASMDDGDMLLSYFCRMRQKRKGISDREFRLGMGALNAWVEAAEPFFASCEHYAEDPGPDGLEEMVIERAEDYLDMVLPDYAIQVPAHGYAELLYREGDSVAADEAAVFFPDEARPELLGAKKTVLGGLAEGVDEELLGAATDDLDSDALFGGGGDFDSSGLFGGAPPPRPAKDKHVLVTDSPYARKPQTGTVKLGSEPSSQDSKATLKAGTTNKTLAEVESEAAGRRRRQKRAKKNELGSAVLELYKKERLEKARRRAEAQARKEAVTPTKLDYNLSYRGLKNSERLGGYCHFGVIELKNIGGGELKGTVEPNHPSVKAAPSRFEQNSVKVTYQIDPSDMPSTGRVGLSINTQDERIEFPFSHLVPTSWWREREAYQAAALMLAPSLMYLVYVGYLTAFGMGPILDKAFADSSALASGDGVSFGSKVVLWLYAMLALLPGATGVPAVVKVMFSKWSFDVQRGLHKVLLPLMLVPSAVLGMVMYGTDLWSFGAPLARLPILAGRFWMVALMLGLNGLAGALFSTQTTVWWELRSDTAVAQRTFRVFWILTAALGVGASFFMSVY